MADSTRKSQLSAAKQALLAQRLKGRAKPSAPTIPCRQPGTVVPLSFSQQRLWFLYQFAPENPFYNVPFGLHLKGTLDVDALDKVLHTLMQRHEVLRTTFADGDSGTPQQIIHPQGTTTLEKVDLSALGQQTWDNVEQLAKKEVHQPFNLYQGPLLRTTLLKLSDQEFVLLVTLHHIISDVWSTGILVREMAILYQAFTDAKPNPLPPLAIQYADFTLWQRQQLQGENKQIRYWQQQFATIPPVLQLPTDRPRPAVQSFRGDYLSFSLSSELTNALKSLGKAADATLFMTLLAAFKALLYRYTGQTDISIGSPIANRNQAAIEGLIGLFMNTLALRTQLEGTLSFRDLLERVREVALGAYSHQDLPFEKLVEVLQLPRELSHTPLFQVMVILQNAPNPGLNLPGLSLTPLDLPSSTAKFDLTLTFTELETGLQGSMEYNSDLFDRSTIERLLGHFQVLVAGIVAAPETALDQLPLLTPEESAQLQHWQQADSQPSATMCLHHWFEARVEQHPDAIALIFEQEQLTYSQLNQRANQLAHHLRTLGVGPETLVGLCVERSISMVVGLLGILKAGGAYVPLDPTYPPSRLQFMLEDANISVLLTQASLLKELPELTTQVVCLEDIWSADLSTENPKTDVTANNLAYIIYTSGSTGTPKGVMIPHQNVVRLFKATEQLYHFTDQDCWTFFHSYAFDFSVWELWGALLYGGRLVIVPYWVSRSPEDFYTLLVEQQVSVLNQTPSAFSQLIQIDANYPADALKLRYVIFGGEALAIESLRLWFERHGDQQPQLVNMYGITETTVHVTHRPLSKADLDSPGSPIGKSLADLQSIILDKSLQPVPIGIPGELHIGGAGLARGYLNRPELTAERFIANPFGADRLYKTGDLARYLPNGTLEYLGRIDHQVKVRGFRIELGEIEAALQQHDQVRDAIVMVRTGKSEQQQLIGYLTPQDVGEEEDTVTAPCSVRELREWLETQLPDYMVPPTFVWLAQMPLNANGKVDRAKLQTLDTPSLEQSGLAATFVEPRSHLEQQLAHIWSQVLNIANVGIDDNFFELGGDSILSLQIVTQANQAGLELTPKQLFQHQTIRTLATVVQTANTAEQGAVTGPVPLTPMQQWILSQPGDWHQSLHLELQQPITLDNLQTIVHHLINHHDALRLRFQQQESGWIQDNGPALEQLPPGIVTQASADDGVIAAFQQNLDLSTGPLIRAVLLTPSNNEQSQQLLLIAHQLIVDHVSWHILTEDFQTLLQQQMQDKPLLLPAKTHSFQQWAHHQMGASDRHSPLEKTPEQNTQSTRQTLTVSLGTEETQALLQQVPSAYRTQTSELLLTALAQTYASQAEQLTVDFTDSYRAYPLKDMDLSRTVGWLTCLYPISLDLTDIASPGTALKAIKEQRRQAAKQYFDVSPQTTNPTADIYFSHLDPVYAKDAKPELVRVMENPQIKRELQFYKLQLDSSITEGKLQLCWTYDTAVYPQSTIEPLAQTFLENLRSLITHCLNPEAGSYTPSDFPLAQLDQDTLDRLVTRYPQLEDCYPLTPIQQGFLFHALYSPEDGTYVTQICCRLKGELDIAALQQTWQHISDRHPILRTAFVWEDSPQPLQIVQQQVIVPWQMYDWRSQSSAEQKISLANLLQQDRTVGFEPQTAPLMRPTLVQVAADCYDIIWSCHHILLDGWAMPMVIQEIFTLYEGLAQGQQPILEERRPYRDYVAWLSQQDLSTAEEFWTSLLKGFHTPTPLGYQKTQEAPPNHEIQGLTLKSADAINALAQQYRITLNTLIQGTWTLLLSYISGHTDIVFGATTAGRPPTLTGVDKMIGLFINTLPVRVNLTPDMDIMTWMQAIQTQRSDARQYEYSPLNQIQRWSDVPTGTPLFESLIVFENYRVDPAVASAQTKVTIQSEEISRNNNYPLTLRVLPHEEFVLEIMSDRTCFAAETTDRWLHYLDALLQWVAAHADATVGEWQAHLLDLEKQWQQQQAQNQAQSSLKKLRKIRRKAVRSSHQEESL